MSGATERARIAGRNGFPWPLREGDQLGVAVLLLLACCGLGSVWLVRGGLAGRLVDVEQSRAWENAFQVDVNSAPWPELALLPGIGETLARRIIDYRQQHGPFRQLVELENVRGIGPRTVARLAPFIRPLDEPARPNGTSRWVAR